MIYIINQYNIILLLDYKIRNLVLKIIIIFGTQLNSMLCNKKSKVINLSKYNYITTFSVLYVQFSVVYDYTLTFLVSIVKNENTIPLFIV